MQNSLRGIRKAAGLTLQELSIKSGVPLSSIGHFEKGERPMAEDLLRKIAGILGKSIEEISKVPSSAGREIPPEYAAQRNLHTLMLELSELIGVDEDTVRQSIGEMIAGKKPPKK